MITVATHEKSCHEDTPVQPKAICALNLPNSVGFFSKDLKWPLWWSEEVCVDLWRRKKPWTIIMYVLYMTAK